MGYMEGNLSGMDYSYSGAASHYPLWKPPSGYFPRGEAPPPYEEAVAISQAEALSAQCTVSVATATHRGVDLSGELRRNTAQMHQQQQQQHHQQQQQQQHQHQQQVMPTHHLQQQQPIGGGGGGGGQLTHQAAMQNHHIGILPHQQHQHHHQQQNQITQSTTNLINININSGGNVTTIATGENHQPPYSLQNDGSTSQMLHPQQEHQLQQHHHSHQSLVSGRLHLPSNNSICVQTMTSQHQQQQQQQQLAVAAMPNSNAAKLMQQQQQQKQQQQQQQQSHHQQQQQQQALCQALQVPECNYKNCQLNATAISVAQRRMQRSNLPVHAPDMLQQYVTVSDVDLSSAAGCNITGSDFELIASPTQFSNSVGNNNLSPAISTPTIDVLSPLGGNGGEISTITSTNAAGHSTLPSPHSHTLQAKSSSSSNNNNVGNKTPSSTRRYHRTIPRYFAISDPLRTTSSTTTNNGNETLQQLTPAKCVSKSTATNTLAATSSGGSSTNANTTSVANASSSSSSSASATKKPTCQCPVQHVPMSYMGSNQLSMNAQQHVSNNVFISALNHKLNSSGASSSSGSNNSGRSSLSYGHRSRSNAASNTQQSSSSNSEALTPNKRSTHNSPFCNHEPKIATISKQVGDSTADIVTAGHHSHHSQHHHQHHHHQQHNNDGPLVVLSKVPKKSSGGQERLKSAGRSENSGAAIYLNGKVDAYLHYSNHHQLHSSQATDSNNPVLPPKLYKSLTNLKAPSQLTTPYATSTQSINRSNQSSSVSATSSPQISHASKAALSASTSSASSPNYINTNQDLPPPTPKATMSSSSSSGSSGQTVYSIRSSDFLTASKSSSSTLRKDEMKNMAPSLTLPPPSPTSNAIEPKSNKINSSTFYPLQNNHVTYTLPKHISGKISLNSTIANVVSKVPSVISIPTTTESYDSQNVPEANTEIAHSSSSNTPKSSKCTTLPKILRNKKDNQEPTTTTLSLPPVSPCNMPAYPQQYNGGDNGTTVYRVSGSNNSNNNITSNNNNSTSSSNTAKDGLHLPVCTTSKNCLNPKEHFLPNDTSLDDDYLSECENCKIAQSSKYYLNAELIEPPQETMTLQRKSMDDSKEDQDQAYYRISHTLPTNPKKNTPIKNNKPEPWFSTIPASSSSEEDVNG